MQKSITVKIQDNEYKVDFPSAGALIDVEVRKSLLSKNQYYGLLSQNTLTANFALDLIDATAHFGVLIPELKDDLNVDSILELDIPDAYEVVKAYKDQFVPWYEEWMQVINGDNSEEEKDEE